VDVPALSALERRVTDEIARRRDDVVALASDLIGFDTTARDVLDPPRDESALQEYLAERLRRAGAAAEVWEPRPEDVSGSRLAPPGLAFDGRPQMAARFAGAGGGRSLLLNGHIDVVSGEPREQWSSDPNRAEVRDGLLYGRGACDMKGGVAAMTFAAEVLASLGVRLDGDLIVCTVTDEESTGAGGVAAVAHGVAADAGIVTEPSTFDAWVACRGSLIPTITVPGRSAHAGVGQPDWRDGGGVNAIEKAELVLQALRVLQEEWRSRPDHRHPYVSPGDIVPVTIEGGHWIVSYPASCRVTYHVAYLPVHADVDGWGGDVARELTACVERAAAADAWLAEHPPTIDWAPEVPASEVDENHPLVQTVLDAGAAVGRPGRRNGMDSWHDGATFTLAGTPCICYGPSDLNVAHTVDEHVPVDDLVACAQALAVAALRFCGTAAA
jgi:acetylornithine deacetylase